MKNLCTIPKKYLKEKMIWYGYLTLWAIIKHVTTTQKAHNHLVATRKHLYHEWAPNVFTEKWRYTNHERANAKIPYYSFNAKDSVMSLNKKYFRGLI